MGVGAGGPGYFFCFVKARTREIREYLGLESDSLWTGSLGSNSELLSYPETILPFFRNNPISERANFRLIVQILRSGLFLSLGER